MAQDLVVPLYCLTLHACREDNLVFPSDKLVFGSRELTFLDHITVRTFLHKSFDESFSLLFVSYVSITKGICTSDETF